MEARAHDGVVVVVFHDAVVFVFFVEIVVVFFVFVVGGGGCYAVMVRFIYFCDILQDGVIILVYILIPQSKEPSNIFCDTLNKRL